MSKVRSPLRARSLALCAFVPFAVACGGGWELPPQDDASAGSDAGSDSDGEAGLPTPAPHGLHVAGNRIEDALGNVVVLHGVNRSGTEYRCIQSGGFFDGDSDEASVRAMASWNLNAVRVPLNESCWLGINGAPGLYSGDNYKSAIKGYVALLERNGLVPILDLHWAAPGSAAADRLQPMPNADHTPAFWSDVAGTFLDDDQVVFEPFNEPFPGSSPTMLNRDTPEAWQCWRDGCMVRQQVPTGATPATYQAAGMQSLVDAIRQTGARHLILLGGLQYSNALSEWQTYKPVDALDNLAAAWHVYNYNPCADSACWSGAAAALAANFPIVATEIGENDCQGSFVTSLMQFLDALPAPSGYLAWSWNTGGACVPAMTRVAGDPYKLIGSYATGRPNGAYAQAFHDHVMAMAQP